MESNIIFLDEKRPKQVEWNFSKQILVGKNSDGYMIMQALQPLFGMGWSLSVLKGDYEPIKVQLSDEHDKTKKTSEGSSISVALRRMSIGMSKQFSHMRE